MVRRGLSSRAPVMPALLFSASLNTSHSETPQPRDNSVLPTLVSEPQGRCRAPRERRAGLQGDAPWERRAGLQGDAPWERRAGLQRLDRRSPTTRRCLPNLQAAESGSQLQADAILRQSRVTIWTKATPRIWNLLTKQPWTKIGTCVLSTDGVRGRQERNPGMDVHGYVSAELALSAKFSTCPCFGVGATQNTIPIPGSDHIRPLSMEIFLI